jgi:OmpA-OmpF porin, OOP family
MLAMRQLRGTGAILALLLLHQSAAAQSADPPFDSSIDVQLMDWSIGPKQFFTVDSADIADNKQLAFDAFITFLKRPFSVYDTDGDRDNPMIVGGSRVNVVDSVTAAQLTAAYGLSDKLHIGASLPLVFSLNGDGLNPTTGMSAGGVQVTGTGDLRLQGKYRLWQSTNRETRLAGLFGVTLPTSFGSNESQFIGDDLPTLRGSMAATWSRGRVALGANAGFILRKPRTIYASTVGQQLTFGAAANVALTDKFSVIGELFGRGGLESGFALDESPVEAVGGFRLIAARSVAVTVGGGAGLDRAIGAPQARFFFSLGYAPDVRDSDGDGIPNSKDKCPLIPEDFDGFQDSDGCPDDDNDGDRRPDSEDKCPNEAEDIDGFEDDDGCPELDNDGDGIEDLKDRCPNDPEDGKDPYPNDGCPAHKRDSDGDGIPDSVDMCPLEEEDMDGFEDGDGCPELDNDGDGIPDAQDRCPLCPEDKDGFEDEDGCPELDNDRDGIPDAKDACPNQPETFNGIKDDDGCPDTGGIELVKIDGDVLTIGKVPTMDKKGLTKAGDQIVAQIAGVMLAHYEVTRWLLALAQPKEPDAQRLAQLIKARLAKAGVTNAEVLGRAGPARIGGVVQERADEGTLPACPAGMEVQQRPEHITPKATMQPRPTNEPTVAPKPRAQPAKANEPEIEIE